MTATSDGVAQAAERRLDAVVDREIDEYIDRRLKSVQLAAPISAHARVKLRFILRKYAKDPHPFRSCARDNMKRFGPGRTEAVCATLKDVIVGNKNWRRGGKQTGNAFTPFDDAIDGEVLLALDAISEHDLQTIFLEARALEECGSVDGVALLDTTGREELLRWGSDGEIGLAVLDAQQRSNLKPGDFALPPDGYPMHDKAHAANALARAEQHASPADKATIKARVCKRWPGLPGCKA